MRIGVLATGGTIVSLRDERGNLRPAGTDGLDKLIKKILAEGNDRGLASDITYDIHEVMNLDSTNIGPKEWYDLADYIKSYQNAYDGFLVTHGTDTMSFTGAALALLLRDIDKPVIITGAMIPLGYEDSDAEDNLAGSLDKLYDLCLEMKRSERMERKASVHIYFAGKLMDALWTVKVDSTGKDAMIEIPHGDDNPRMTWIRDYLKDLEAGAIHFSDDTKNEDSPKKVGIVRLYPGFDAELLKAYSGYDAVILETFGAGGVPDTEEAGSGRTSILQGIKDMVASGVKVYAKSQCIYGGSDLMRYAVGRSLLDAGATDLGHVTTETAYVAILL